MDIAHEYVNERQRGPYITQSRQNEDDADQTRIESTKTIQDWQFENN